MTDPGKDLPRVFGPGGITVCVNSGSLRMYVGHSEVAHVSQVTLSAEAGGRVSVSVGFDARGQGGPAGIEESVRLVQTVPWAVVSR